MRLTRLRSEAQLLEFQVKTRQFVGVQYPIEYLTRARVYAFTEGNMLRAGFFFISQGPLRTIRSLPAELRPGQDLTEVSGIWIEPEMKTRSLALKFWLAISACAFRELGRTLIFTYSVSKPGLEKMYATFSPTEIYRGNVKALEGMECDDVESINVAAAYHLAFSPLTNAKFFFQKLLTKRNLRGHSGSDPVQIFKVAR